MSLTFLPTSLFGRLMTALLSVVAIMALITAILIGRERQDLAFRRSDAGSVVELVAATSIQLAQLAPDAREAELARLRAELLSVEGGPPSRLPPQQDPEQAADLLERRLVRELGAEFAIDIRGAQPDATDVIRVVAGRRFRAPVLVAPGEGSAIEPRLGRDDRPTVDAMRARLGVRDAFRELDIGVVLPDGEQITYRTGVPFAEPPLPRGIFYQLLVLAAGLGIVLYAMARTITRPLADLAAAAEAVGRGARVPLRETGARELRDATRAFNTMQERLHRYLDSRTGVLSAMSHDLRTPLTRLKLRAESLDDAALRERFNADLDEMQRMVTGALNLFRGMNHEEPLQQVDVAALLAESQRELAEVGVQIEVTGTAAPLSARPTALKRCIGNLLSNAAKYGTKPSVAIDDSPSEVVIRVLDEGPGIAPEMLEQVFEPFFRLESSRNADTGGVGLGLSIARDVAQAHGGSLTLRNRSPHGLEAILRLPRAAAA